MEERDGRDRLVLQLIQAAVFSGAYSGLVRAHPEARGLVKLYVRWDQRVTALAEELAGRVAARPRESL